MGWELNQFKIICPARLSALKLNLLNLTSTTSLHYLSPNLKMIYLMVLKLLLINLDQNQQQFIKNNNLIFPFPIFASSSQVFLSTSSFREVMSTLAPHCRNMAVIDFPNPVPPPVTTIFLPFRASGPSICLNGRFVDISWHHV